MQFLIFTIENQYFALELSVIERVVWAVELSLLPTSPSSICGAINLHGKVIPVVNMRKILELPERELALSDQFIICKLGQKSLTLWVDSAKELGDFAENALVPAKKMMPENENIRYVIKNKGNLVLVYDWEKLLKLEQVLNV